ncbi:MAG: hypothetical protein A3F13_04395 [Gammaproteobacteria bacterium RIFCSPHIGHO2_12_FULL_40_19]|nr:MAG: hypothetical protein A3F13_04395 [Gammaproteobacteria bacterium RIFCSPHIGHO2_12_FULL_40_19]
MRKWITVVLVFFGASYGFMTFADSTDALDQATVTVVNRSSTALQMGLQAAFSEVLVRMSGNPEIMSRPSIKKAALNLTQWVQSYSYLEMPNTNTNAQEELFLQVSFDGAGLQQLLHTGPQKTTQADNNAPSTPQSGVLLVVAGVKSMADYVQVMHALRAKNDVTQVSVKNVKNDQVFLRVKISGDSGAFQQVLAADNNFKSIDDGMQSSQLQYYWMGNQA